MTEKGSTTIEKLKEQILDERKHLKSGDARAIEKGMDEKYFKKGYASQEGIAKYLGISRQRYGWYEDPLKTQYYPDPNQLKKLCELYHCDYGHLLGEYTARTQTAADIARITGLSEPSAELLCDADNPANAFVDKLLKYNRIIELAQTIDRFEMNETKTTILEGLSKRDTLLDAYAHSRETRKSRPVFVRQLAKAIGVSADMVSEVEGGKKSVYDLSREERKDYSKFEDYQEALYLEYERFNRRAYVSRLLENFVDWIF